jgi:hypothetical protein
VFEPFTINIADMLVREEKEDVPNISFPEDILVSRDFPGFSGQETTSEYEQRKSYREVMICVSVSRALVPGLR